MPDTIAALFKEEAQAESAVGALRSANFDSARTELHRPADAHVPDAGGTAARGIAIGCIGGTALGLVLGVIGAGLIPGSHTFLQGGLLVPLMLATALGATGGLGGLLLGIAALQERSLFYEQEVQSGRFMVSVDTEPERLEDARNILLSKGAMEASSIDSPTIKRGGRRAVE
ncbi:MAG TPA: hypothetical protein VLR46_13985 [Candidatus Dormibacteraeota bacterium]|nr:hypothetical protein [Candidatus Dormibacteraeota bacterium]